MNEKIKCKTCGYTFPKPLDFCPQCLTEVESPRSPQEWWLPYAKPEPQWDLTGYLDALGKLKLRPISDKMRDKGHQGYFAGLCEGEGRLGWYSMDEKIWYPLIEVKMASTPEPQRIAQLAGIRSFWSKGEARQKTAIRGLRVMVIIRIIHPSLTEGSKWHKASTWIIKTGIRTTTPKVEEYRLTYRATKGTRYPIPIEASKEEEEVEVVWIEPEPR